jgi:putative transposase
MTCVGCGSASVTERRKVTAQGYKRFRCWDCGRQFNERSDGVLNRTSFPRLAAGATSSAVWFSAVCAIG